MVCLDTDIIVHFLRKNKEVIYLVDKIIATKEKIRITSVNEFELWKGIYKIYTEGRDKSLKQFLLNVDKLSFDSKSSKKAAEIFESLNSKGEMVDALDVMIASVVMANNESLLTMNKKHFERIEGLKLV